MKRTFLYLVQWCCSHPGNLVPCSRSLSGEEGHIAEVDEGRRGFISNKAPPSFPINPSPVAMHLPVCLRKVHSPLLDSIVKPKGPVSRESIVQSSSLPHRCYQGSGQWWKPGHPNSVLMHLPKVTQEPEPRSPESSPTTQHFTQAFLQGPYSTLKGQKMFVQDCFALRDFLQSKKVPSPCCLLWTGGIHGVF